MGMDHLQVRLEGGCATLKKVYHLWTRCTTYNQGASYWCNLCHYWLSLCALKWWCVVDVLLEQGCTTNDHDVPLMHHDAPLVGITRHMCSWYTIMVLDEPLKLWGMLGYSRFSNVTIKLKVLDVDAPNGMMRHYGGRYTIMMCHGESWWAILAPDVHHVCSWCLCNVSQGWRF